MLKIREKVPRENLNTFQELLERAREAEMLLVENNDESYKPIESQENLTRAVATVERKITQLKIALKN